MNNVNAGAKPDTPKYVKDLAKEMRKKPTEAESLLWEHLRRKLLDFKFYRQYPIGRYIADFCCPERELVIELDGGIHDSEERKEYDKIRDMTLESSGMKMLRFRNEEIFANIDSIIEEIFRNLISCSRTET